MSQTLGRGAPEAIVERGPDSLGRQRRHGDARLGRCRAFVKASIEARGGLGGVAHLRQRAIPRDLAEPDHEFVGIGPKRAEPQRLARRIVLRELAGSLYSQLPEAGWIAEHAGPLFLRDGT